MANDDIKIIGQKEATAFLANGQQQRVIVTSFTIGNDGPFSVSQDEASFDPTTQHQLVLQKAEKLRAARQHPSFKS